MKENKILTYTIALLSISLLTNAQNIRHIETINDAWSFYKGEIINPFTKTTNLIWEKVDIPHSWNTLDILDDEDGYYRGDGWYKKTMVMPEVSSVPSVEDEARKAQEAEDLRRRNRNRVGRRSTILTDSSIGSISSSDINKATLLGG